MKIESNYSKFNDFQSPEINLIRKFDYKLIDEYINKWKKKENN